MKKNFSLAPMSPSILVLTLVLWLLPFSFLVYFFLAGQQVAGGIALFLFVLYGIVWAFCRPSRFEVVTGHLEIVFPAWKRNVEFSDRATVRMLSADKFKQEYGWAMRIGIGGLWGGFGWLWTSKGGLVEFYVSQVDGMVMIERRNNKNILVTPDEPEKFVASMENYMRRQ
jgi:hypothetical protein